MLVRWVSGIALAIFCWPAFAQEPIQLVMDEPQNIDAVKKQLQHYQSCSDSNCYVPQLERQADIAIGFLKQSIASAKPGDKLAIVLDIDETSLSNWEVEVHDDFGFIAADLNWCIHLRCGKAIGSTRKLFREAKHSGVAIFFITGRLESQRTDTEGNLKAEGYEHWADLFMRADNHPADQSVEEFKSGERAKILARGYHIVLNVGDQMSDLRGYPQADHSVKLPNPFYFIP